jgi:hypothetical protein
MAATVPASDKLAANGISRAAFARLNGWDRAYVTRLAADGRLVEAPGGGVLARESLERIRATADPAKAAVAQRHAQAREQKAQGGEGAGSADRVGSSYQAARAVKERYQALQAKLEYEKAAALLVDADAVRRAARDFGTLLRRSLESLPEQNAPQLAAESDPARVHALLADAVEIVLADLAHALKRMTDVGDAS